MNPDILTLILPEQVLPREPAALLSSRDWADWLAREYARLVREGKIVPGTEAYPVNFEPFEIPHGLYGERGATRG